MSFYSEKVFPLLNQIATRSYSLHRKKVLLPANGKLLEIGFGSGLSLDCYPPSVEQIVGLDPNPGMLERAELKIAQNRDLRFKIIPGSAERIPFPDQSFEGAVSFLTLCSVEDLPGALSEIKRILKPGGKLFFIEHTIQPPGTVTRKIQKTLQPLWQKYACGCHIDRDTLHELRVAGFEIEALKPLGYHGFPNFLGPVYRGVAALAN